MDSSSAQDVSLYELALSAEQVHHPLKISPNTFKSMIETVIDVLIDQQLPATLWVKLPSGHQWQAEIDRFCQGAIAPCKVYVLTPTSETVVEDSDDDDATAEAPASVPDSLMADSRSMPTSPQTTTTETLISDDCIGTSLGLSTCPRIDIPLAANSHLRREYFLLVQSQELSCLLLTHRPRSIRSQSSHNGHRSTTQVSTNASDTAFLHDYDDHRNQRKHPLLGLYTFHAYTLEQVFEGIRQAIDYGCVQTPATPQVEQILENWSTLTSQFQTTTLNPSICSQLFSRQVQTQEKVWGDTSAYRRQSSQLKELQLENEQLLNDVQLKDEFLKNVGQELRAPLTTMRTALSLLESDQLKPAQKKRYMEMLVHECDRQSSLITSVLELLQLEQAVENTSMQPIRVADVVPGVVSTYQPLAEEKGIRLAYTIPPNLPAVSCLNSWLRQIVINLLHNSIKFTPEGGEVWVTASQHGDYVQLEFRDTGIGIATADIPKIFDRFYRIRHPGDEETNGAGLGLSIVQQLLLRCNGSVSVRSKLNSGSMFNILLPVY